MACDWLVVVPNSGIFYCTDGLVKEYGGIRIHIECTINYSKFIAIVTVNQLINSGMIRRYH